MATQSQNIIYSNDTIWALADSHDLALEELKSYIGEEEDFSHLKSALADPAIQKKIEAIGYEG